MGHWQFVQKHISDKYLEQKKVNVVILLISCNAEVLQVI